MKKLLKVVGIALVSIVAIVGISLLYIGMSDIPSYEVEKISYEAVSSPAAIERGEKLASMLCAGCHLNRETGKLTGKRMLDAPAEFGVIYSRNITQDKKFGIGE